MEAIDVSDVVASLANQVAPMTSILVMVLSMMALVAAFRWVRVTMTGGSSGDGGGRNVDGAAATALYEARERPMENPQLYKSDTH